MLQYVLMGSGEEYRTVSVEAFLGSLEAAATYDPARLMSWVRNGSHLGGIYIPETEQAHIVEYDRVTSVFVQQGDLPAGIYETVFQATVFGHKLGAFILGMSPLYGALQGVPDMRKIPNKLTKDDERAAAALLLKQNYIHQAAEIGADGILQRQRAGNELRIPVLRSVGVVLLHTERQAMQATRRRWQ